jgi:hypothetical protein
MRARDSPRPKPTSSSTINAAARASASALDRSYGLPPGFARGSSSGCGRLVVDGVVGDER